MRETQYGSRGMNAGDERQGYSGTDADIIVCGGGMAGLAQALALADSGLRIVLLDQGPEPVNLEACRTSLPGSPFSSRVSAITPASQAFLDSLGAWPLLAALRSCAYREMQVWDSEGSGQIHFSADSLHLEALGHIVENQLLVVALAECARQRDIDLRFGVGLQGLQRGSGHWLLQLDDGSELSCRLLVGADGAASRVRSLCGFPVREWSYEQRAIVCTVRCTQPHAFTAWQSFLPTGPLAFLPLHDGTAAGQHCCSIVWSCDEPLAGELLALPREAFAARLASAFERRLGEVEVLDQPRAFPLQQRHARDYVKAGVVLVGDAAHSIHPLAGQGINLGFADAAVLAEVLQQALQRGEPWDGEQVLSRYARRRKPENLAMMAAMEGFKRGFGSETLWLRLLRNQGLNLVDRARPLKDFLMKRAMGL